VKKVVSIVLCIGKVRETRNCIRSLLLEGSPDYRILIVENGTRDNLKELSPEFPDVHFINLPENEGFTGGVNKGLEEARRMWKPDYYFLLNNDAEVEKGALAVLIQGMQEEPACGMTAPKIYSDRKNGILWSAGGTLVPWRIKSANRGEGMKDSGQFERREECPFLSGCALLIRDRVVEDVGLLDNRFFAYLEDLDYCLRVRQKGWKLIYEPKAIAVHAGSSTAGGEYEPFQSYYRWRNRFLITFIHAGFFQKIALYGFFFPLLMARDMSRYMVKNRHTSIPYLWNGFSQFLSLAFLKNEPRPFRNL